ncbi:MAG TPA: ABC transporter permease, partial [Chloroflexota bacterium]|nr:ABC transporter permease [Chloroflexota bacterium]
MLRYFTRRVITIVPVLIGVSLAVFLMIRLVPGDVVTVILGSEGVANAQRIAQMRHYFGLDQPLYTQYFEWLGHVIVGNFGASLLTNRPVLPDVVARIPVTAQLTLTAMILSLVVAVPLGVISAVRPYGVVDAVVRIIGLLGLSIPNFWLATLLVLFVSLHWPVLPTSGYVPLNQSVVGSFKSLILPAVSLAVPNVAILMRMTRSSMLEVLRLEYVTTAQAKGLDEWLVLIRHALPNAMIPVVTVAGIQVGYLLGGTITHSCRLASSSSRLL